MSRVLDDPAQVLFNCSLQEAVLLLWQVQSDVGTIMSLCHISEDELNEILPRALWRGVKHTKCPRCNGCGSLSHAVPWEQDDWYRPKLEAAKAALLLLHGEGVDWQQVVEWKIP